MTLLNMGQLPREPRRQASGMVCKPKAQGRVRNDLQPKAWVLQY